MTDDTPSPPMMKDVLLYIAKNLIDNMAEADLLVSSISAGLVPEPGEPATPVTIVVAIGEEASGKLNKSVQEVFQFSGHHVFRSDQVVPLRDALQMTKEEPHEDGVCLICRKVRTVGDYGICEECYQA